MSDKCELLASVIIYSYKRKEFIVEALNSVSKQSIPRNQYEIIVVKGFNDPAIDAAIESIADVSLYVDEQSHGKKLREAITRSKGEVIFLLDDDDLFEHNKLEVVTRIFCKYSDVIFVHNSMRVISESGIPLYISRYAVDKTIIYDTSIPDKRQFSKVLRYRGDWYGSCMAFRKNVLLNNLDLIEKAYQSMDPFLFLLALKTPGKLIMIPDLLTRYRIHNSTTNYVANYHEFIDRKKVFYHNSAEVLNILRCHSNEVNQCKMVDAMIEHMQIISVLMDRNSTLSSIIKHSILQIKNLKNLFVRYYLIWLLFVPVRMVSYRIFTLVFFWYGVMFQTSQPSHHKKIRKK